MTIDRARLFLWSRRRFLGGLRLLRAVFDGFWLGVLDEAALARINANYYDDEPAYLDDAYTRSGLRPWESDAVDTWFADRRRVVVTSAGGGREVLALLRRGYDAVGFEPQAGLVRYGRELLAREGHPGRLHHSAFDDWPAPADASYDGAIIGWGAYMLIPDRARRVGYLRAARASLPAGAPVLISFFSGTHSARQLRVSHAVARLVQTLRGAPPTELGDVLEPNRAHCFTRREIADEVRAAGLELVSFGVGEYGWAVARTV